ncbi:MAG: peptidylprolyl isomerase, partial [Muribaculaceae bacterium]|nr:peptidylprolyl isomerase [Muribaculaceae bacterium]
HTIGFVEALDRELAGKTAGDKFDFYADPEEAFGPYSEENIHSIPREQLTIDGKFDKEMFTPGNYVPLLTPEGYQIDGLVADVTPDAVVFDLNHPMARHRVHYVGEVVTVRNPTEEELNPHKGCCCGGGCGSGCDNGGCDDGACCGK